MRTRNPEQHEARRRAILDAAAVCFAEKGFERTRTADIAARAGISSGNLFHYFPSKRAIFVAIFETETHDVALLVAGSAGAADPWAEALRLIGILVEPAADQKYTGLAVEVAAQAARDADFAQVLVRYDEDVRAGLATLLGRAAERGQTSSGFDAATEATWVMALVDAMFSRSGADPGFLPAEQLPVFWSVLHRFLKVPPAEAGLRAD